MHLLVSFRSVRHPSRAALGLLDVRSGRARVALELPAGGGRCDGLGGLAQAGRTLYATTAPFRHLGESEPSLLCLRASDLAVEARYRLDGLADLTGLYVLDGSLYVVSSGTGEVVAFRTLGDRVDPFDRFTWRPRIAVEGLADPILHALALRGGELFASATDRASFDAFLFNVTRDFVAARALQDPQSLAEVGGSLCYAAGRFGAVHLLGEDFIPTRSAGVDGLARGLCVLDGSVFAASSADGRCTIHRLSADDLAIERSFPLDVAGAEVADLLPIEGLGDWPDPPEPFWLDSFGETI
ncbi:hypothetical protein [Tautonia plasticadhaerens]|uniref:DUF4915 domain-containing protein n=1 Tax=Tautonia plasticadhaerens TaxID=2527974 RepID=A0A518GWY8_9BACT|nr:hypothetical protein [Tautonia plasticadhaerens]QDV33108.1 hypothetical protein ElP_09500 [Tautonia plasticadhaerens]